MKLALAGFGTVVALLLVACGSSGSSSGEVGTLPPRQVSTGTPSRPPSRPTPPPPSDDDFGDDGFCPIDVPLTAADLDQEIGWKPGAPAQGSCSATDLQKLAANFKSTNIKTYFDLANGVSDTCRACVVSKDTDAKWGPIVGTAENDGETGFVNYGACFGAIEGEPCGKAIQYESFCTNIACNECATTAAEREACIVEAIDAGGMCKSFATTRSSACPSWTLNVKSCGDVQKAIATLCGTP